jgi:hypothetical protein
MPGNEMRASNADRDRVVAALQRHTAAGRLSLDEFTERVDRALASRTQADLDEVVRDLPAEPEESTVDSTGGGRHLLLAFAAALLALLVIGVAVALFR